MVRLGRGVRTTSPRLGKERVDASNEPAYLLFGDSIVERRTDSTHRSIKKISSRSQKIAAHLPMAFELPKPDCLEARQQ